MRTIGVRGGFTLRFLAFLLGFSAFLSPLPAAAQADASPLDLAAMLPSHKDLENNGYDGYSAGSAFHWTSDQVVEFFSADGFEESTREILVDDAGLQQYHRQWFYLPTEDDPYGATQRVSVSFFEFTTKSAMGDVWEWVSDDSYDDRAEDLRGIGLIGDLTEVTQVDGTQTGSNDPLHRLDLSLVYGTIVMEIDVTSFTDDEPDLDQLLAFAEDQLDRIDAVRDGEAPGLSTRIVRLDEAEASIDQYIYRDGEYVRQFADEPARTGRDFEDYFSDTGLIDIYQYGLIVGDETPQRAFVAFELFAYESEAAAAEGIEHWPEMMETIFDAEVDVASDAPDIGDAAMVITAEWEHEYAITDDASVTATSIIVQVDEVVAVIRVQHDPAVSWESIVEIAELQAECLEAGNCQDDRIPTDDMLPE